MKRDHNHPPLLLDTIDLETMTIRELGELAEQHGLKLLDVITL